jgi:fumarate reductase flavoprotein subunit
VIVARKVILASGGFGASAELLSRYIPKAVDIPFPGHSRQHRRRHQDGPGGRSGDGKHGRVSALSRLPRSGKARRPPEVALSGGIMVDGGGKRFVNETHYPGGLGTKMLDLPGKQAYEIFDERIYQLHRNAPGLRNSVALLR